MKFFCLLFTVLLCTIAVNTMAQNITYSSKNASPADVIKAVKKQAKLVFIYDEDLLKDAPRISITAKDMPVYDFLALAFKNQSFSFTIRNATVVLKKRTDDIPLKESVRNVLSGTPVRVAGRVVDSAGHALAAATVLIVGKRSVATADQEGYFSIQANPGDVIMVTYVGFRSQTYQVGMNNVNQMIFSLSRTTSSLQEVAVVINTGYQQIARERTTGSFVHVDSQLIKRTVGLNIIERLDGLVPGLYYDKRRPTALSLQIRGISSLASNGQPLIILDKFPFAGDLNSINPDDIESVTILRDAAAASIWGARAGNGVIVLTSKKGKFNQRPRVSASSSISISDKLDPFDISLVPMSETFAIEREAYNVGLYNGALASARFLRVPMAVDILHKQKQGLITEEQANAQLAQLENNDIRKEYQKYVYRESMLQSNNVTFDAGGSNYGFRLSASYDKSLESSRGNDNQRMAFVVSNRFRPINKLTIDLTLNYTRTTAHKNGFSEPLSKWSRYDRFADDNGNPQELEYQYQNSFLDTVGGGRLLDWKYRPLDEMRLSDNSTKANLFRADFDIRYNITRSLSIGMAAQYVKNASSSENHRRIQTYYVRDLINTFTNLNQTNVLQRYPVPKGGIMDLAFDDTESYGLRPSINYDRTFNGKHEIVALAGAEIGELNRGFSNNRLFGYTDRMSVANVDLVNTYPTYLSLGGQNRIASSELHTKKLERNASAFFNASYTYDKRYAVTGSARKDASNIYGVNTNQKGEVLWSAGARWNLSNEKFYRFALLPDLKFRASYGYSGTPNPAMSALTLVRFLQSGSNGLPIASIDNYPNPDLRWEKVGTFNVAVDFSLKGERISGSVDYFNKVSTDLFGEIAVDPTVGRDKLVTNYADMNNRGFDIAITSRNILKRNFQWTTTVNLSYTRTRVTRFEKGAVTSLDFISDGLTIRAAQGHHPFEVVAYRWGGLDPNTGGPRILAGDKLISNPDSINTAAPADLAYLGSNIPLYFGNMMNTVVFKGLSLSFNISYSFKFFVRRPSYFGTYVTTGDIHADYMDRWKKPGDELITNVPAMAYVGYGNRAQLYEQSTALVEKGDHIRLNDLRLSYAVRSALLKKLKMSQLSFFAMAYRLNILLWKANKANIDPFNINVMKQPKSYAAGINVGF